MTTIKYAASGEQRKQLVNALSEVIGCESKYLKAPSYGYEVGSCVVNRTGDIEFPDDMTEEEIEAIVKKLTWHGFERVLDEPTGEIDGAPALEESALGAEDPTEENVSDESIISKTVFEQVQEEIARRQSQIKMATHTFKGQFSGLLTCANCGKHFRRRIANASSKYAKPAWLCSTFATRGKRFCNNKQIPEAILISKTKEVLGLCSLDGVNLRDYISEIICHKEQNITFVLTDGDEITVAWSNSSRRNSWTEEMKQAARQKTLERSGL